MADDAAGLTLVKLPDQKNEVAAAGDHIRRHLEELIENQKTIAKIRRAAFLAYVAEGFTEAQALDLCWRVVRHGR
jgi:hypothetical protein